jgi:hypothetical protein
MTFGQFGMKTNLLAKVTPVQVDFKPRIAYIWHSNFSKKKIIITIKKDFNGST